MNKIILLIILISLNAVPALPKQPPKLKLPWDKERVALALKGDPNA